MQKVEVTEKVPSPDPIVMALNPTAAMIPQFTIIPTGGINNFAMADTIQQLGKVDQWDNITPYEYWQQRLFEYSRSKGGYVLGAALKMAQTKLEVSADDSQQADMFKFAGNK